MDSCGLSVVMNRKFLWELTWLASAGDGLPGLRTNHLVIVSPFLSSKSLGIYLTSLCLKPFSSIASTKHSSLSSLSIGIVQKKISCCKCCFCLFFRSIIWENKCVILLGCKNPFTFLSFSLSFSLPPSLLPHHTHLSISPTPYLFLIHVFHYEK